MAESSSALDLLLPSPSSSSDSDALWRSLGLDADSLSNGNKPNLRVSNVSASTAASAAEQWGSAVEECVSASVNAAAEARKVLDESQRYLSELDDAHKRLLLAAERLASVERDVARLQAAADAAARRAAHGRAAHLHLSAFVHELALDPALVRHVVDGRVGDERYEQCLAELSKKIAVYEMRDTREAAAYPQLRPYLDKLLATAVRKVEDYLLEKIALLKRPNTNVSIVKESVLLPHRALVDFLEEHSPERFMHVRSSYIETMSKTYFALFKKYAAGLFALKQQPPADVLVLLVGSSTTASAEQQSAFATKRSLSGIFTRAGSAPLPSASDGSANFALDSRVQVLRDVTGPAIVLAVAQDNKQRFAYEHIHRSIGKMLCETCSSEHTFCEKFFGDSDGRMFDSFFKPVVAFLLETLSTHLAATRDTIGVLLAFKINEAQRSSMQKKNILDLSDYFIQVDILLKPKFKKLLDENVQSLSAAAQACAKSQQRGERDTAPHTVTRRYAEFSAAVLTIAEFGSPDDSITDGIRRLRAEYSAFLNSFSALFQNAKYRYMFLINNVDLILSVYAHHRVSHTDDHRTYAELQGVHTAAFVEHEVADHFPDLVSFVREYERLSKSSIAASKKRFASEDRVRAVLKDFATNWRLSVEHMQESVIREFQSFSVGSDMSRALFARLLAYHKRCEVAIDAKYPVLRNELVTSTEIIYELRQRAAGRPS